MVSPPIDYTLTAVVFTFFLVTSVVVADAQTIPLEKFVPKNGTNQSNSFRATNGSQQQPFMGLQQPQQQLSQTPIQQQQQLLQLQEQQ
jgi:hypothetical protein